MDFSNNLIVWYNGNKRDLPWRHTKDPYYIWLSEIILQQTRVEQGLSYYQNFVTQYPNINLLANAKEEEVLKLWQGLGYYSRARNLHYTAKDIVNRYSGQFPTNHSDILALKGVGEYTAAAIASFAYELPFPVIDGNVYRVLSRLFGIKTAIDTPKGKHAFKALAEELLDRQNSSTYNQAIMEFGALQCKPKNPNCELCPFKLECTAFNDKIIDELPFKSKKIKQRNRYFNYLVINNNNTLLLNKRTKKDIWEGLFDFPLIESKQPIDSFDNLPLFNLNKSLEHSNFHLNNVSHEYVHILSHQKIHAIFWEISPEKIHLNIPNTLSITFDNLNKYPVPKLIDNYLKTIL